MNRSQMYKKVNRRNNVFNHLNRNVVYPSLFLSSDEINNKGSVEIIELKSDEELEKQEHDKSNYSHVWCYESDEQDSNYRINKEARERRRRVEYDSDDLYNELFDQMCTNFYGIDCHNSYDGTSGNQNTKCFTIINNRLPYNTSSDDDEELQCSDAILNGNDIKERSFEGHVNNGYGEKRTVWIYSEKNKELDDSEYQNKNSTSSSTDNEDPIQDIKPRCIRRLATPIPTYIPKLLLPLSPTLPTVTEVTESFNKSSSNTEINQSRSMTTQMPINNWMQEKSVEQENDLHSKVNSNTFTWDALTPREKRRIKNSITEENFNIHKIVQSPIAIENQFKSENQIIKKETDQVNECITNENELSSVASSTEEINNAQKPQIKIKNKIKVTSEMITEPLEKENGKWIGNETDEILDVYDYDLEQNNIAKETEIEVKNNKTGNKFLVTNMSLLKPMEWTQYLPITGSIPSLHLSFETETEENRSCFKRLFRFFKCCKRNSK